MTKNDEDKKVYLSSSGVVSTTNVEHSSDKTERRTLKVR